MTIKNLIATFGLILFYLTSFSQIVNEPTKLKIDKKLKDISIKQNEFNSFSFELKKDIFYFIIVEQNGIDVKISMKDQNGRLILDKDSPNGMFGPERFDYSPDSNATFILLISPLIEAENSKQGLYDITIQQVPKTLKTFNYSELVEDFEILKNGLIETKVGLWYNSYAAFDSLINIQKAKIKDKLTALEFYQITAPIVAFTKEGHCFIRNSPETLGYLNQNGMYLPFIFKILEKKVYLANDFENFKTKGLILTKINENSIQVILDKFLSIQPSDGYNVTGKYRWIESAFSKYYAYYFEQTPKIFTIELIDPKTKEKIVLNNIKSLNFKNWIRETKTYKANIPNYTFKEPATFIIDSIENIAILTINSMNLDNYKGGRKEFKNFLEKSFNSIATHKTQNLIIDIRKNGGGQQGMEDHLLSYLIDTSYKKYNYVEVPGFSYSFTKYTDYKNDPHNLNSELREWFYQTTDGRFIEIEGRYKGDKPKVNSFKGNVYILISGLTFSGGSEFAALAKNHTKAKFIGEETSGGYYGNTSGKSFLFTLPNTNLTGQIPLEKFIVYTKDNTIPFGYGLSPDYLVNPTIEKYLNGIDEELNFTKKLIQNK
jgi:Peptidase family S41